MNETNTLEKTSLLHNWLFWLLLITGIAIIIRSIPAWTNAAWGVDFGIYYGLTNSFVETKTFILPYDGWGSTYQYFPVLYAITGTLHWITDIGTLELLPKIAPIFGGLTIPIFYFISYEILKDKKTALLASSILAVAVLHVYQTSHAAPLTIGHFFMMLSFYFFIRFQKKPVFTIPLAVSTILLIFSHHFTTYFYIICITFICLAIASKRKKMDQKSLRVLSYVVFVSAAAFSYWYFIATPVYQSFMAGNSNLPSLTVVILYYSLLFSAFFILSKYNPFKHLQNIKLRFLDMDKYKKILLGMIVSLCLLTIVYFTGIPGVHERFTLLSILYSLPMVVFISFSYAGLSKLQKSANGYLVNAWIIALLISLIYSLTSTKLLPNRHFEYLIIPLCIPAALTLKSIIDDHPIRRLKHQTVFTIKHTHTSESNPRHKRNILVMMCIVFLFVANIMSSYPAVDSLNFFDERVSDPCVNMLEWMDGNVSNTSVIASDHRIENLIWAEGFGISYGCTNNTWIAENLTDYVDELITYNVTHIIIDDIMRNNVVNFIVGKYYYMTNESYDKFKNPPFELIYRNATYNNQDEEIHWIELYKFDRNGFTLD